MDYKHSYRQGSAKLGISERPKITATDRRPKNTFQNARAKKVPMSEMIYLVNVWHDMIKKNCAH